MGVISEEDIIDVAPGAGGASAGGRVLSETDIIDITEGTADVPEDAGLMQGLIESAPEIVAETAAGALTAARRTPFAAAVVGTAAAGTEAFRQIGEAAEIIFNINLPLIDGSKAPQTSKEAGKRILAAFARGSIGEGVARGLLKGLGIVGNLVKPTLKAGAKEAIEAAQPLLPKTKEFFRPVSKFLGVRKPVLLPAEATESSFLAALQDVAEAGVFGRGFIKDTKALSDDIVSNAIAAIPAKLKTTTGRIELGELIQNTLEGGSDAFRAAASGLYKNVDEVLGEAAVDVTAFKNVTEEMLVRLSKGAKGSPKLRRLLRDLMQRGDKIPFEEAQLLRSDLLAIGRESTELISGQAQGIAKKLGATLGKDMDNAAANLSDEALAAWKTANSFFKEGRELFSNKFVNSLVAANPEDALAKVLQTGKASNLKKLKNAIFDKRFQVPGVNPDEIWQSLQGTAFNKIFNNAVRDEITGELSGEAILKAVRKTIDPDMMKVLAPKGELNHITNLAKALSLNQRAKPDQFLGVAIRLGQAGALGGMFFEEARGESLAIFLAPLALSRALTNPSIVKALTQGVTLSPSAKEMVKLTGRLAARLTEAGIDFDIQGTEDATQGGQQ